MQKIFTILFKTLLNKGFEKHFKMMVHKNLHHREKPFSRKTL